MNKNKILIEFTEPDALGEYRIKDYDKQNQNIMPPVFKSNVDEKMLRTFIERRTVSVNRHHMEIVLGKLNLKSKFDMLRYCKGLSLTDSFWVKPTYEKDTWQDVSLYTNKFDKALGWMAFTGIPSNVSKQLSTPELTTVGILPKFWDKTDSNIYLVKGGTYGYANAGLEPISEVCTSVVGIAIGINCTDYVYKIIGEKPTSVCPLFTTEDIGLMTAQEFEEYKGQGNISLSLPNYIELMKSEKINIEPFRRMMFFDDLVRNHDRHLNNWGFAVDNNTRKILGFSQIWDTGESLIAKTMPEDFPLLATSEESFSSFDIPYKNLRNIFYGMQEKHDCYKIQRMINNGNLMQNFKRRGIPDTEDNHLKLICDILQRRLNIILKDIDMTDDELTLD